MTEAGVVDAVRVLVECESPSGDFAATSACAELVSELAVRQIGVAAERLVVDDCVHLRWSFGRPRVLLLAHLDTVWPVGTLARWPFAVDGDMATGPGVFDMKAGIVQLFMALAGRPSLDGLAILVTSDEEVGSGTSQALIERTAGGLDGVLVLEPSADGALKIARKGVGSYHVQVTGRAAHAGLAPHLGINSTVEVAHHILTIADLGDAAAGTTVTPTLLTAGTTINTVPSAATLAVDVRASTVAEMNRVGEALVGLVPRLPGAALGVTAVSVRPPLEVAASQELFARAQTIASRLNMAPLEGVAVGGGSDGNLTAAIGVPTLDGLGAVGGNAHAEGEWISVPAVAERARLVAGLIDELLAAPEASSRPALS